MAIHAEAVDILVRKARFEPEVAIGVAEAIEVSITLSQLVTVPILDARLQDLRHELKSEIQAVRTELKVELQEFRADFKSDNAAVKIELEKVRADVVRWVFLTMLGNVALTAGAGAVIKMFSN